MQTIARARTEFDVVGPGAREGRPVCGISPLRPEHERDDPLRLLLDAWRREADAWGKRLERSDDAAGGLLTA